MIFGMTSYKLYHNKKGLSQVSLLKVDLGALEAIISIQAVYSEKSFQSTFSNSLALEYATNYAIQLETR